MPDRSDLIELTQKFDPEDTLVELYVLEFEGTKHYFQGSSAENITFRDSTGTLRAYVPLPLKIAGIEHNSDGSANRPSLTVANSVFSTLSMQPEDFVGARITRRQTLKKYLTTNPPIEFPIQKYVIDRVASSNLVLTEFELAAPFDLAGLTLPKRKVIGQYCPWEYQGADRNNRGGCTWRGNNQNPDGLEIFVDANDNLITSFTTYNSAASYPVGALVKHTTGSLTTIYRAVVANPTESPSERSTQWVRAEMCGKRLSSCKARFHRPLGRNEIIPSVPLPFGAFPGSRKFR